VGEPENVVVDVDADVGEHTLDAFQ
jgi:hypothetical protein